MKSRHSWLCPYCNHYAILGSGDFTSKWHELRIENAEGYRSLYTAFIVCPNDKCRRITLRAALYNANALMDQYGDIRELRVENVISSWPLIPQSEAKTFPAYIPQAVIDDYNEGCLIKDLSPKASATLSRRCLQGIIRDFWKVTPGKLVKEIEQIKDRVEPEIWDAIESVRKVGNIGAHMEADINVIVDVDPGEASALIGLIEMLLKEWYVNREERKKRLEQVRDIAEKKAQDKKSQNQTPGGSDC